MQQHNHSDCTLPVSLPWFRFWTNLHSAHHHTVFIASVLIEPAAAHTHCGVHSQLYSPSSSHTTTMWLFVQLYSLSSSHTTTMWFFVQLCYLAHHTPLRCGSLCNCATQLIHPHGVHQQLFIAQCIHDSPSWCSLLPTQRIHPLIEQSRQLHDVKIFITQRTVFLFEKSLRFSVRLLSDNLARLTLWSFFL